MISIEQLMEQKRIFVSVEWPESQAVQEQWWCKEAGSISDNDAGNVLVPIEYYIKWKNGESCIMKYDSLQDAKYDFECIKGRIYDNEEIEDTDEIDEMTEELFKSKCGFSRPELITKFL